MRVRPETRVVSNSGRPPSRAQSSYPSRDASLPCPSLVDSTTATYAVQRIRWRRTLPFGDEMGTQSGSRPSRWCTRVDAYFGGHRLSSGNHPGRSSSKDDAMAAVLNFAAGLRTPRERTLLLARRTEHVAIRLRSSPTVTDRAKSFESSTACGGASSPTIPNGAQPLCSTGVPRRRATARRRPGRGASGLDEGCRSRVLPTRRSRACA